MTFKIKTILTLGLTVLGIASLGIASAQDSAQAALPVDEQVANVKGQVDGLNEDYLATKATVDKLAKIKVSGYIQAQWQHADSSGISNVAGGTFPTLSNQRFQVRRGRLKTTYEGATSRYVLQFDVVPAGLSIKDAYVTLMEPWLKSFSYTMGVFDRPFGFEISYSSSSRESPERTRVYQALFPGERDMGAKLEFAPPSDLGMLRYFNLKGGLFTGLGPTANEIDSTLDFIGRAGFQAPFYDLNLAIDGGVSYYAGKVLAVNDSLYQMSGTALVDSVGVGTFVKNKNKTFDRNVMGVDLQVYYTIPVIGDLLGGTSLRGEYLSGKTIGTLGSSSPYGTSTSPMAERKFMGYYLSWVQNFGSMFQTVLKYDVYDPNTKVKGADIGLATNGRLSATDIQYTTLGGGLIYHWDGNLKLVAYYDMVTNEKIAASATGSLLPYTADLKDNVFTLRMQAKF